MSEKASSLNQKMILEVIQSFINVEELIKYNKDKLIVAKKSKTAREGKKS